MAKAGQGMTQTATPERVRLAHIVASGLHQLAAAAAQQSIQDRIERGKADASLWVDFNTVAGNMKAPYIEALAKLAGDDFLMAMTCNESCIASDAAKGASDDTDRPNTDLHGTVQRVGKSARRGASAKRSGRK
jgi:SAM-dependent MidA family methyltransferase